MLGPGIGFHCEQGDYIEEGGTDDLFCNCEGVEISRRVQIHGIIVFSVLPFQGQGDTSMLAGAIVVLVAPSHRQHQNLSAAAEAACLHVVLQWCCAAAPSA
jgi:hypothetical protein